MGLQARWASPVVSKGALLPGVLAVTVGVPQAEEGVSSRKRDIGCNAVAVLGAAADAPLGYHQLQSDRKCSDSA